MQGQVCVHDADARDRRQVETARHELRAHQDVGAPFAERLPDLEVRVRPACHVAVEAQHPRPRPQLLDHRLQPLRAHAQPADVPAPAVGTRLRHRPRVAAVVTDQPVDLRMLHERHRAAEALHRAPALAAHHVGGEAAPVQVEDRLLLVLQRPVDRLEQAKRKRLHVAGRDLIAHVDQLDARVLAVDALVHRRERHLAGGRLVIRGD